MPEEPFARIEDFRSPLPKRRFNPIRFKDVKLSTDRPYLVKGVLPRDGLIVVWGPPKCGKSFWVFDLVLHVTLGWDYRGHRVQPGTVVYIACEGERGLGARTEAFRERKLSDDADPPFFLLTTRLDLVAHVDELIADIRAQLEGGGCAAIVMDTLNRSIAGSESKDEDMGCYVKAADRLREEFQAAVIIIHHCGTNENRPRGHTSLTGAADAQISVKRDGFGHIVSTVEWLKDGAEGELIASRLEVVEVGVDEDGEPITSCVVQEVEGVVSLDQYRKKPLSGQQGRALQLLANAIDVGGELPPACNHIPPNTRCVTERVWRDYCARGQISVGDKHAQRTAYKRAAEALLAAGHVGKWDPWVWIASH
jgi:AAA domain